MQPKETDPQPISDVLLRYVVQDVLRTSQWATYSNDVDSFKNAYLFIEVILEKIVCDQSTQLHVLRNPYYGTYVRCKNFTRY